MMSFVQLRLCPSLAMSFAVDKMLDAVLRDDTDAISKNLAKCVRIMKATKGTSSDEHHIVASILAHHMSCILPSDTKRSVVLNRFWDNLALSTSGGVGDATARRIARTMMLHVPSTGLDCEREDVRASLSRIVPVLVHCPDERAVLNYVARILEDGSKSSSLWVVDMLDDESLSRILRIFVNFLSRRKYKLVSIAAKAIHNIMCHPDVLRVLLRCDLLQNILVCARAVIPYNCVLGAFVLQCYMRCLQVAKDVPGDLLEETRDAYLPHMMDVIRSVQDNGLFHLGLSTKLMHLHMYFLGTIVNFPEANAPIETACICEATLRFATTAYNMCAFPSECMESILYFTFEQVLSCASVVGLDDNVIMSAIVDSMAGMWKVAGIHARPRCSHVYMLMKFVSKDVPLWICRRIVLDLTYARLVAQLCSKFDKMHVSIVVGSIAPSLLKDKSHLKTMLVGVMLHASDLFSVDDEDVVRALDEEDAQDVLNKLEYVSTPHKFRRGTSALVFVQAALKVMNAATLRMVLGCESMWNFVGCVMREASATDVAYAVCATLIREVVGVVDRSDAKDPKFYDAMRAALPNIGPSTRDDPTLMAARSVAVMISDHADALLEVHKMQMFERFVTFATSGRLAVDR